MIFFNDKNCIIVKFENSYDNLPKRHLITSIVINDIHFGFYYLHKNAIENSKAFLFLGKSIRFPDQYRAEFNLIENVCYLPKINTRQTNIIDYFPSVNLELIRNYFKIDDKNENEFRVNCLFHDDKTPSMTVDLTRGLFYCFSCTTGGNLSKLLIRIRTSLQH